MSSPKSKPLIVACQNSDFEQVKALLSQNTPVDDKDSHNRTALFYCASHSNLKCISELVKAKADLNSQDKDGFTPLHAAIIAGNIRICEYLVKHGADVNLTDSELHSVVHWAVVCGYDNLLNFLLKSNADPEMADIHGAFPIHYAAQMCGQVDIWDQTIVRDSSKSLKILKKLIEHNVKVDAEDFDQRNAIIWAASSGSSEAIIELYKAGSDPNKHEKDGLTALHCASSRGYIDCIRVLIEICKVSVDIMDNNNCTPIFYAATLGQENTCEILIKYGANLHVQDCKGRTVYHCAAAKGKYNCLEIICKHEPNIWLRNRRGDYPIQEAYYNKQIDCVYLFLEKIKNKKAAKSSNMYDNCTLLHNASADNDLKLCKKLIDDGAEINSLMKTYANGYLTPLDVAEIKNSQECYEYIYSRGGVRGNTIADQALSLSVDMSKLQKEKSPKKVLSMTRVNEIELDDDDNVFNNSEKSFQASKEKRNFKKSMSVDQIDFSNQMEYTNQIDLAELNSKNTSGNLNLAIKEKSDINKEQPKKNYRIYRDRSAQTLLCSTKQDLVLVEPSSETIKNDEDIVEYPEEFTDDEEDEVAAGEDDDDDVKTIESIKKIKSSFRRTKTLIENNKNNKNDEKNKTSSKRKKDKQLNFSDDEWVRREVTKEKTQLKYTEKNERQPTNHTINKSSNKKKESLMKKKEKNKIKSFNEPNEADDDKNNKKKSSKKPKRRSSADYTNQAEELMEESTVKLIFETDEFGGANFAKKYPSLYEKQRLLLKSLYDIRRYRLNNKDIIISADLNNLLIKMYDFDIKKNCKSLKELEKTLEYFAQEMSDECKQQNKKTLMPIKKSNSNLLQNKKILPEKIGLSRSNDAIRFKNEQNIQSAYRSILPNDIYKQYYNTRTKMGTSKENIAQREKTLILPIISQTKPAYSNLDKSFLI